jgi:hypothetical protein
MSKTEIKAVHILTTIHINVRFKVLTVMSMKMTAFWVLAQCNQGDDGSTHLSNVGLLNKTARRYIQGGCLHYNRCWNSKPEQ